MQSATNHKTFLMFANQQILDYFHMYFVPFVVIQEITKDRKICCITVLLLSFC